MIDINELRQSLGAVAPEEVGELLDRLEVAEKERDTLRTENAGLVYDMNLLRDNNTALRAKIETMEKQEPVKIQHRVPFVNSNGEIVGYSVWIDGRGFDHWPHRSLYLAPGAQPTPSVPTGFVWPECPKRRQSHVLFDDGYEEGWAKCVATMKEMLAAAPEDNP